jgi:hypothetical protein
MKNFNRLANSKKLINIIYEFIRIIQLNSVYIHIQIRYTTIKQNSSNSKRFNLLPTHYYSHES